MANTCVPAITTKESEMINLTQLEALKIAKDYLQQFVDTGLQDEPYYSKSEHVDIKGQIIKGWYFVFAPKEEEDKVVSGGTCDMLIDSQTGKIYFPYE
jgi:hypothetical protein